VRDAEKGLQRIQNTIFNIKNALTYASNEPDHEFREIINAGRTDFIESLEDDFNVPGALAILFSLVRKINANVSESPDKAVKELTGILGLTFEEDVPELVKGLIEEIIRIRSDLRAKSDFESADRIREGLSKLAIILEDRSQGTAWKFNVPLESQQ
jgi:cysteinyl-tRNA synthetase